MANIKSAIKRIKQSKKREARNSAVRSRARTFARKVNRLLVEGRVDEANQAALDAMSALDRAVTKGVLHCNNAARRKSRLMKRINQARSGGSTTTAS